MSMVMLVLHTESQSRCRTSFVLKYFHRKGQQSTGWRVSIILISDFLSPIRLQFRRRVRSPGLSASNLHTYMRLDSRSHQIHDIWSVKEILNRKLITISKTSVRRQVGLIISLYTFNPIISDNGQLELPTVGGRHHYRQNTRTVRIILDFCHN